MYYHLYNVVLISDSKVFYVAILLYLAISNYIDNFETSYVNIYELKVSNQEIINNNYGFYQII